MSCDHGDLLVIPASADRGGGSRGQGTSETPCSHALVWESLSRWIWQKWSKKTAATASTSGSLPHTGRQACVLQTPMHINHTEKQRSKWKLETQTCKQQPPKQSQILPSSSNAQPGLKHYRVSWIFQFIFLYRRLWLCLSYIWPESYSSELCGSLLSTNLLT